MNTETLEPPTATDHADLELAAKSAGAEPEPKPAHSRFRKKPVVISAIQWTGENFDDVRAFVGPGEGSIGKGIGELEGMLSIMTLEGVMTAQKGDFIIKGVKDEFYPCKPDIFAATYEGCDDTVEPLPSDDEIAPAEETTSAKATPSPLITLWLPQVRSSKSVPVYGAGGKRYMFTATKETGGRPARHYFDVNVFAKEERDIRDNRRNVVAVCTLLGTVDPATRAEQAVQALIEAAKVPAGMRKAALLKVLDLVAGGLAGLDHIAAPAAPVAEVSSFRPVPVQLAGPPERTPSTPTLATAETSTTAPTEPPAAPTRTWQPKEAYSEAQLSDMPLEDLRALAAYYQVAGTFRREIIRAWAKK